MRNTWTSRLLVVLLTACFCQATIGRCQAQQAGAATTDLLEQYLQERVKKDGFSGSVLVAKDGRPIFVKSYGLANAEHDIPNKPATKFRIGSISKPITALIILMLVQQGKLKLEDPVRMYVPEAPEAWAKVTIHHLLSHTSGVPQHNMQPAFKGMMTSPTTPKETIRLVNSKPLKFTPGEKFEYCNTGYVLLGMVAENVTKKRYADLVQEKIFVPLGMKGSGCDEPGKVLKERASGYVRQGTGLAHAPYIDMSWPFAAGAIYSTVEDLLLLDEALYTDKLLSKELRKKMFTPVKGDYGYGWTMRKRFDHDSEGHGGSIPGFFSYFLRFPEDHLFVAVLCNTGPTRVDPLATELARIALGVKSAAPKGK